MRAWRGVVVTMAALLLARFGFGADPYGDISDLKLSKPEDKVDMKSVPAPKDALVLFDGKNFDHWTHGGGKTRRVEAAGGRGHAGRAGQGQHRDEAEVRRRSSSCTSSSACPTCQRPSGQGRGNSGVYVQGRYEVQVLDSYGLKSKDNDCGGIYTVAAPLVNACKAPTVWQSYDIEFAAPLCKDGKVT